MSNWFNHLKIRNKLIWAFMVMISLTIIVSVIAFISQHYTQATVTELLDVDGRVARLGWQSYSAMLMVQRSEKDYFLHYKPVGFEKARATYVNPVQTHVATIHEYMTELRQLESEEEHIAVTQTIDKAMVAYETTFQAVVDLLEKRGFKNSGLEGQFWESVHAIEEAIKAHKLDQLAIDMLTIRRHENAYLLQADDKHIPHRQQAIAQFKQHLADANMESGVKEQLVKLANQYQATFEQLVQIDTQIAAHIETYRAAAHRLEPLFEDIYRDAQHHEDIARADIQSVAQTARLAVIGASLVAVFLGFWIAFFLAGLISQPLTLIVQGAKLLTAGDTALTGLDQTEIGKITNRHDEMGNIGRAFDDLAHYFKTVIEDIVQISQGLAMGKLSITPQSEYRGDFVQIKEALQTALSNQRLVVEDIVQVSQGLAAGNLSVTPQSEYRGDFIQIKQALETALSNQRLVIEDIVQVSQGLAMGNLSVTPQSEYQGDFVQIKDALETALSNQRLVIEDIVRVSQGLAAGNLSVTPQSEYQGDFAQIKNAQETALSNQRQVIKDIVHVSQGLAGGNLHVMSQAHYQGDYVQIKEALENALSNLRLVIEDIVQVSQGLAEGEQSITPMAEYRGDFVQIKNALETAAAKLAETTAQNAMKDWLKTGHAQLNDLMSGEQDIVVLAKKIVSFLTTYTEAQVGLFYLLKESSSHKPSLQMIANYAYITNDNRPTEFLIGEGLVGQAALERQPLSLIQTPEECRHIMRSGLANALPRHVLIMPCLYENAVKGVIEIGSATTLTNMQQDFLEQVLPSIGIAVSTAESRTRMQELLAQSQRQTEVLQAQSEELQAQQEELQQTNDALQSQREELESKQAELQQRNEELQSQAEELQSQSEELQTQQEELKQTNEALEERTKDLERQKGDIQHKNQALEQTQTEMKKAQKEIERKAQELALASKYKSEFLANMSHELRTPLNSLLILAQLLADNKQGNLSDKQVEYVQTIHSAGSDLLTLINEILDLSKVEAGKIELQTEDISLADLVEMLEQKFRPIANDAGLTFQMSMAEGLPAVLHTDGQRLKQILTNLLSNAFKFTSQGGIQLTVQRPTHEEVSFMGVDVAQMIAISITDTGIGIPKDKQQVIFEAFQQVDGSTSRRYGGTGLGLSISRQLARFLGGDIRLHSEEGKGCTFTLYLPKQQPTQASIPSPTEIDAPLGGVPAKASAPSPSGIEPLGGSPVADDRNRLQPTDKSILIIEDDRKFSSILTELAREKAFKCLVAEDGRSGLQLAEEYLPNAIILDVGLPQLDGWTVMEKLKDNPDTRHIPVHFISASNHSLDAQKMGAIGYLHKPVTMEQLGGAFKKIEQFLSKTLKQLLVVVDAEPHQQKIGELVDSEDIQITQAMTTTAALQHLKAALFDCIILDMDIEQRSGIKLLEQMQKIEGFCQTPVITYTDRELTSAEEALLLRCADHLPIKSVKSPERLLEEATRFLHQIAAQLPKDKRNMLKMVHDKEAILTNKKVLIADDDIRNTFALTTVLEDKNMEVVVANNGKEALEELEAHSDIAIVLMDIMMPEMDGYEAMRAIRKQPHSRKLPIIALTAKAMKGDKAKCLEAGANDYISKPVDTEKLISLMRVWLYR
ncbi:MAG: hybrid sensor histidine kinase/response regulator [Candidatus Parabeggiatoa sp. nov. 1]|nr:MAG: hybrid sensor histidine kinase/response regulator [Gammaproteobacteria bacterium]